MKPTASAPTRWSGWLPRREFAWRQDVPALLALMLLAAYFVAVSWRKWPDPLIDFGRELYTPWRLSHGAVLSRDVDAIYGPLSQYGNAALFALFGPGLMVLVAANLALFAAILIVLYGLFRRAFGMIAALAAGAVFVAVFGFSQIDRVGNYNFATPYAHQVTHGFLVCLLLVAVLVRWVEAPTPRRSLLAGGLLGLTAVLKPEFMLAGGVVTIAAVALRWRQRGRPGGRALVAGLAGAVLPTLLFTGWFALDLPAGDALAAACRGWLNVVASTSLTGDAIQLKFMGLDQPRVHGVEHAQAAAIALGLFALLAGGAWAGRRAGNVWLVRIGGLLLVAALLWIASSWIAWPVMSRCLPPLAVLYAAGRVVALFSPAGRRDESGAGAARLLLALLAVAFVARMVLNGRIGHYGFWQAALAAMLVPAVLIGELPVWIRADAASRRTVLLGTLALVVPGVIVIAADSRRLLDMKTLAVGEGRDRFYAFSQKVIPTGEIVRRFAEELAGKPDGDTLLVLPEGIMLNYLARKASPLPEFLFASSTTQDGREAELVRQLESRPPQWVVLITRDLREYGIQRYGESPGSGQLLMEWTRREYVPMAKAGGDPLDPDVFGGEILRRRTASDR